MEVLFVYTVLFHRQRLVLLSKRVIFRLLSNKNKLSVNVFQEHAHKSQSEKLK